jgi:hypothetical protein
MPGLVRRTISFKVGFLCNNYYYYKPTFLVPMVITKQPLQEKDGGREHSSQRLKERKLVRSNLTVNQLLGSSRPSASDLSYVISSAWFEQPSSGANITCEFLAPAGWFNQTINHPPGSCNLETLRLNGYRMAGYGLVGSARLTHQTPTQPL